jgi:hypothetical protein
LLTKTAGSAIDKFAPTYELIIQTKKDAQSVKSSPIFPKEINKINIKNNILFVAPGAQTSTQAKPRWCFLAPYALVQGMFR